MITRQRSLLLYGCGNVNLHSILCKVDANSNKLLELLEPHSSFRFQHRLLTMTTFFLHQLQQKALQNFIRDCIVICYLWNVLGPVLENCLHHVFIGQWCRTGTLPEDTCCLEDATNVYQAASAGEGYFLPRCYNNLQCSTVSRTTGFLTCRTQKVKMKCQWISICFM